MFSKSITANRHQRAILKDLLIASISPTTGVGYTRRGDTNDCTGIKRQLEMSQVYDNATWIRLCSRRSLRELNPLPIRIWFTLVPDLRRFKGMTPVRNSAVHDFVGKLKGAMTDEQKRTGGALENIVRTKPTRIPGVSECKLSTVDFCGKKTSDTLLPNCETRFSPNGSVFTPPLSAQVQNPGTGSWGYVAPRRNLCP